MPRRPILAAVALTCAAPLALLSFSACGGSAGDATTPRPTSAAAGAATPSSVAVPDSRTLITDLGRAGRGCTASTDSADHIDMPGMRSSLNCVIADASGTGSADVTVAVFDDHAHAAAFATTLTSTNVSGLLLGGTDERAVLGSDWVVLVPDDASYADAVRAALGGTVLDGGSAGTAPSSSG